MICGGGKAIENVGPIKESVKQLVSCHTLVQEPINWTVKFLIDRLRPSIQILYIFNYLGFLAL